MKKQFIKIIIILCLLGLSCARAGLAASLSARLTGRILLQVQSKGQVWYVNPTDQKRYGLGRPSQAWAIMRELSIGITNADLAKIPVGLINNTGVADNDQDGLPNDLETALGTNPNSPDSDQDGYNDLLELDNNYNPAGAGRLPIDNNFIKQNLGKIFLQIEGKGEAWYINPTDQKRYFLGRPDDAFIIMKNLSLGITNENLNQIPVGRLTTTTEQPTTQSADNSNIMGQAATAIRNNNQVKAKSLFSSNLEKIIDYTLNYLDADGRLTLANILSGSSLTSSTAEQKIYSNEVYFSLGGYEVPVKFYVQKQPDGKWLIANL